MYMGLPYISHRPWEKQIYQIYELVGGFPANFLSSCIKTCQNIFFHMIGNESFHFIFEIGAFPRKKWSFKEIYIKDEFEYFQESNFVYSTLHVYMLHVDTSLPKSYKASLCTYT